MLLFSLLAFSSLVGDPGIIPSPSGQVVTGSRGYGLPAVLDVQVPSKWKAFSGVVKPWLKTYARAEARVKGYSGTPDTNHGGMIFVEDETIFGFEEYKFSVDAGGLVIRCNNARAAMRGLATASQFIDKRVSNWVSGISIEDAPRFPWRGMHLDVSRHFFTPSEIKQYIDYCAMFKFNVFHWHLVDDGGWRIEIKKYPKLTSRGAWRKVWKDKLWGADISFPENPKRDEVYGGFYTQKQVKEIVQYASARGIAVVPEIEMPGHCLPAVECYKEISCTPIKKINYYYESDAYCAGKELTFDFLQNILKEVCELFPSKVIHIGGDELDKTWWMNCVDCNKRIQAEHLKDFGELQSYFIKRIEKFLNSKGRTMLGWDEILEGGLAPNAMVMSWRGNEGGTAAAKTGHNVIMSPTSHCYFDFSYASTSTRHVLDWKPIPVELIGEERSRVIGGQANVWTEWIGDFGKVQEMIFPRMLSMSQVLWSPEGALSWDEFEPRVAGFYGWFSRLGIKFYVEDPTPKCTYFRFAKSCDVELNVSHVPNVDLRYAIDGIVSTTSPKYTSPIMMTQSGYVSFANFSGSQMLGKPGKVMCVKAQQVQVAQGESGLKRYVVGALPYDGSKFPTLAKTVTGKLSDTFSLAEFAKQESVGLYFTGNYSFPKDGFYQITLGSDDGSGFFIDGELVLNNFFNQAYAEKTATVYLVAGDYPVALGYYDSGGARNFRVYIAAPGEERREVSPKDFWQNK